MAGTLTTTSDHVDKMQISELQESMKTLWRCHTNPVLLNYKSILYNEKIKFNLTYYVIKK